jgi:hypothetical protein
MVQSRISSGRESSAIDRLKNEYAENCSADFQVSCLSGAVHEDGEDRPSLAGSERFALSNR